MKKYDHLYEDLEPIELWKKRDRKPSVDRFLYVWLGVGTACLVALAFLLLLVFSS